MAEFVEVAKADEVAVGTMKGVEVNGAVTKLKSMATRF